MQLTPIQSTNVAAAGYDAEANAMVIQFKSGTYRYDNVPRSVFDRFMASESKGKFVNAELRPNYTATRL